MQLSELINNYVNKDKEHESHVRKIGRYWSSDINSIEKGYLRVSNFFERKEVDELGCQRIITGLMFENKLKDIFEANDVKLDYQAKSELKVNDEIVIVVKPDFLFEKFLIETKFPFSPSDEVIPQRYTYQLECQYRAFNRKVYLGKFSCPFDMTLYEYTPSDERWQEIQDILIKFNKKLIKKYGKI